MSTALVPMPDRLETVFALVMPLFLLVGHVGLYHFLSRHRQAFTTQLAVILGIGAPVLVSAMLTVQMSLVSYMGRYYTPLDEATKAARSRSGVRSIRCNLAWMSPGTCSSCRPSSCSRWA